MKSSIKELDSTTFWLREPVQYSNSSHSSAVAGASCKNTNCKLVLQSVVPAVVFRSSLLTTHKHKMQGAKPKIQRLRAKPKLDENGQSISVQSRPGREMTMQQSLHCPLLLRILQYTVSRFKDSESARGYPCSTTNFPATQLVERSPMYCSEVSSSQHKHHNFVDYAFRHRKRSTCPQCPQVQK
jgi:hypothetical protein